MKKLATISAILAAVLIAAVTLRAWAQEPSPKGFVENMLETMLASEGRTVVVDNVSISLTGNVTAARVEVSVHLAHLVAARLRESPAAFFLELRRDEGVAVSPVDPRHSDVHVEGLCN